MATVATPLDQDPTVSTGQVKTPKAPTTPSALPVASTPAAPATPSPSPLGASAGQGAPTPSVSGALPVAPAQTSDPMAFQPQAATSSVPGANQFGLPGGVGDPSQSEFSNEQQKNEYWAAQGVPLAGSALGLTPTGVGSNGVNQYDPTQMAAAQSSTANAAQADPQVASLLSQLTGPAGVGADLANRSAVSDAQNAQSRADDEARYIQSAEKVGGVYAPGQAIGGAFGNDTVPTNLANSPAANMNAAAGTYSDGSNQNAAAGTTSLGGDANAMAARINPPTGPANDVNPGSAPSSNPLQQIIQTANQNSGGGQAISSDPRVGNGVSTTPTTPDNALTNSTISVDPGVDRFKIANQQLQDTINNILNPAEAAASRSIAANSFGAGRGVSGMNRTAQGNLESDYNNQRNQLASSFLNPALTGTIQDAYNNAGIAQQQQGFQAGQQQNAFNQAVTGQQLSDNENNQSFNQALQQLLVGSQGDPSQINLILAQLLGGQSATNAQAAQRLAGSAAGG